MADNKLNYGDNLDILKRHIRDDSVDLVYLDPPFGTDIENASSGSMPLSPPTRGAAPI